MQSSVYTWKYGIKNIIFSLLIFWFPHLVCKVDQCRAFERRFKSLGANDWKHYLTNYLLISGVWRLGWCWTQYASTSWTGVFISRQHIKHQSTQSRCVYRNGLVIHGRRLSNRSGWRECLCQLPDFTGPWDWLEPWGKAY